MLAAACMTPFTGKERPARGLKGGGRRAQSETPEPRRRRPGGDMPGGPEHAAVPHTVQPGRDPVAIAAANNFTTQTVAAYNGLSEDSSVYTGETLEIPTEAEGAAALSTGASRPPRRDRDRHHRHDRRRPARRPPRRPCRRHPHRSRLRPGHRRSTAPPAPSGQAYLASNAAANWNAMRQDSLQLYGIDLYPAGPLSAYRSYAQQLYLYDLYVSGRAASQRRRGHLVARVRRRDRPRRSLDAHRDRPDRRDVRLGEDRGLQRVVARRLRRAVSLAGGWRLPHAGGDVQLAHLDPWQEPLDLAGVQVAGAEVLGRLGAAGDAVGQALARRRRPRSAPRRSRRGSSRPTRRPRPGRGARSRPRSGARAVLGRGSRRSPSSRGDDRLAGAHLERGRPARWRGRPASLNSWPTAPSASSTFGATTAGSARRPRRIGSPVGVEHGRHARRRRARRSAARRSPGRRRAGALPASTQRLAPWAR